MIDKRGGGRKNSSGMDNTAKRMLLIYMPLDNLGRILMAYPFFVFIAVYRLNIIRTDSTRCARFIF